MTAADPTDSPSPLAPRSDGLVALRAPEPGDAAVLVAGRDAEFHRWLGAGDPDPQPTACIVVDGAVVGWIDYDVDDRDWLAPGEVNVGYALFAAHRGRGVATRALALLLQHLAEDTEHTVATVLIEAANERSLAVAARAGFERRGTIGTSILLARPVPGDR